ncbi:MAG: hypothetical protein JWO58_1374 [Chitinophagaceae bacterium]|nr:hypothetical protein [Chitinophagaceae bacterium]
MKLVSDKEESFFLKESYFFIALIAVSILTLIPFIFTGFATGDDIEYFLTSQSEGGWLKGFNYAKMNGRFYFSFMKPIFYEWIPYGLGSYIFPKIINVILVAMNYILFSLIVKELFNNRWLAFLCYLIGLVFISVKGVNNPIVSYPIYFSLSFSAVLGSLLAAIKFQQTEKTKYKYISVLFFLFGLLFYENYLIYLPLIVGFIAYNRLVAHEENLTVRLRKAFILTLPFSIVVVLYMTAYIVWRMVFNEYHYGGAMVSKENSLIDILTTITSLSKGAYPLFFYFSGHSIFSSNSYLLGNHVHGLHNVFLHAKIEWVFKATIVSLLFYYIIQKINAIDKKKLIYISIVAITFLYLPELLLACTEKYRTLVISYGLTNYLTTYFSVFPVALLLAMVLVVPVLLIKNDTLRKVYMVFFAVAIGLASIVNDYSNDHALIDLRNSLYTFEAVDEFIKTEDFKKLPENTNIYSPQLYMNNSEISYMFAQKFDWSHYFYVRSGKNVLVKKSVKDFSPNLKSYFYLNYGHSRKSVDQFIAFAPVQSNAALLTPESAVVADSVTVYYYSTYKSFSILLHTLDGAEGDSTITVNGKDYTLNGNYKELFIHYKNEQDFFKPIKIKAKNIDIKSIMVVHNSNSLGTTIELE